MTELDPHRYPIGGPDFDVARDAAGRRRTIGRIAAAPDALRRAVTGLSDDQLDTPYREDGWTVRQVVHHVVDSHLNSYIRFKWGLTEETPEIKTYDEVAWAEQPEARSAPVELSLNLLDALHRRWVAALPAPDDEAAWSRRIVYPDGTPRSLAALVALYAWHGEHHVAHVTRLRERMGW